MRKTFVLACVLALVATAAWAQQGGRRPAPPPPEQGGDLEEMVWEEVLAEGDGEPWQGERPDDRRGPGGPGAGMGPDMMQGGPQGGPPGMYGPGQDRGGRGGRMQRNPMAQMREFEGKVMEFLREFDMGQYAEMQELRRQNPREYMEHMRDVVMWMREVQEIKQSDPEQYALMKKEGELLGRIFKLERQYRGEAVPEPPVEGKTDTEAATEPAAEPVAKSSDEIRKEIAQAVGELFDVKIEMRQREVQELRTELEKHENAIKEAVGRKEELVDRRVREIVGEGEEVFDW